MADYLPACHILALCCLIEGSAISIRSVEGSESVSTTELVGELLTGFLIDSRYLDKQCLTLASAEIFPLNSCITYLSDTVISYRIYSATSTDYIVN
jgi:hypothetical protein